MNWRTSDPHRKQALTELFRPDLIATVGIAPAPRHDWVWFTVEHDEKWIAVERHPLTGNALRARAADTEEEVRSHNAPWQEVVRVER